jgi:ubiquinone/menaquinone biosynthesis C-methylase UbiE
MSTSIPGSDSVAENRAQDSDDATRQLIARLDAVDDLPGAAELRTRSSDLLAAVPGSCVVDVGCGTGRAVAELHQRGIHAVGVDRDEVMVAVARERWPACTFELADAYHLPLADGTATGYRADKLYHALDDPGRALVEASRVLGPGGRVVLIGQDWDGFIIDSDRPELTRAMVAARADTMPSPRAARAYRTLLIDHGFTDVIVEGHTWVMTEARMLPLLTMLADTARTADAFAPDEVDAWVREQAGRAQSGRLFMAVPFFVAAGTRR